MNRGGISKRIATAALLLAMAVGAKSSQLPPSIEQEAKPASLEQILESPSEKMQDGWYIQYSINQDETFSKRNLEDISKLGFNNIHQIKEKDETGRYVTRTLMGNYSSMQEAVQDAERLSGVIDKVGIVENSNGTLSWDKTLDFKQTKKFSFSDFKFENMPNWLNAIVDTAIEAYNNSAKGHKVRSEWIKALLTAENAEYNPNAISYKHIIVSRDGKRMLTVNQRNKVPTAYGLGMISPAVMKDMGFNFNNRFIPEKNVEASLSYFGKLLNRFEGDLNKTFAAYSAGPTAVTKYDGVPPFLETQRHVAKIRRMLGENYRLNN